MQVSAILLAAGNGSRFGGNKLLESYEGKALYEHTLQKVLASSFKQVILVTQYSEIANRVRGMPVELVVNPNPERGISSSIQLGLQRCLPCDGIMFFVCDQPHLRTETISGMLATFSQDTSKLVSASYGERRGNPVIFPYALYDELMGLRGDHGGSILLQDHQEELKLYAVSHLDELMDIDYRDELTGLFVDKNDQNSLKF